MKTFSRSLFILSLTVVGSACVIETNDADGDGVRDGRDLCPNTAPGVVVDSQGCAIIDSDGDGVEDARDQCPGTPFNVPVDSVGCPLAAEEGTLSTTWLINGFQADATSCAQAGIDVVRFTVVEGSSTGPVFREWETPCSAGGFDSRSDATAPTVPLGPMYFSHFSAINAGGASLGATEPLELQLGGSVNHAVLASADFVFEFADELEVPIVWETIAGGAFGDCNQADVAVISYSLRDITGAPLELFAETGVACADSLIFSSEDNASFGPGTIELRLTGDANDGTKWSETCEYEYGGGVSVAPQCSVRIR